MARKTIKSLFDRDNLLNMNENFLELYNAISSIPKNLDEDIKSIATEVAQNILSLNDKGNLFLAYKDNTTLSNLNGTENDNDTTVTSRDFIAINDKQFYTIGLKNIVESKYSLAKVAFYDENKKFISITGWINLANDNNKVLTPPTSARYVKIVVNNESRDQLYFNVGDKPYYLVSDDKTSAPKQTEVDKTINLVQETKPNYTLSSTSGSENANSKYSVTDFISIISNSDYTLGINPITSTSELVKYAFYDSSKIFINLSDWVTLDKDKNYINIETPSNAKFIRIVFPIGKDSNIYINKGLEPYFVIKEKYLEEGKKYLKPYPNKLMWKVLDDSTNIKPLAMNREGTVIYASNGARVSQSTDEGKTWTYVGGVINGQMVQGIRVLDDGELIVTTSRDKTNNIKSKLYKSSNYSAKNPENTTYTEKLEMHNLDANFNNPWCLDNYYNIVLASDYGGHYLTGARYVYMSTDYGDTWKTIFDQKEVTETVEGAPSYTTDAHVHTCHYDRYRDRIWVCVGDQDNTATYYSDDMGKTWKVIKGYTGKGTMQYTGITSYPEGVFFGSDRAPDGVYFWDETKPDTIEPFYLTERDTIRTLVYALPFRRFAEKDEICYFVANRDDIVDGKMGPLIVGFKGIKGAQLLYDFTDDFNDYIATDISGCIGNTVNGYVLVSVKNKNTGKYRLLRAKAPVWE
ncbi:MAG: sialidase family protein [Staphylococcus haemolyticus]|nr:glycoside hydrolase [Staphylococcus haemolyticus]WAI21518.1 MAG: sialidase family protein [Staphylococcus haemolyticus]WAI22686.1 MAG: sialidase family protein [Staphylococcus haemolyticus]